jgi:hypothetical protein
MYVMGKGRKREADGHGYRSRIGSVGWWLKWAERFFLFSSVFTIYVYIYITKKL